ncbi:unnamed protein product [Tuber melanosporum]|uniref:(Perigord truffle) hypothetical protein n=1 Tax=Tuber melanosporum (strain Mel28) TaxID=656061 RepID=D5G7F2_TUBMM|nr:uncharacterized protein GSTUM_00002536001 [Tuber melanosporum]CAZ80445.1 unnamed protein product [Tuber melanosporum]
MCRRREKGFLGEELLETQAIQAGALLGAWTEKCDGGGRVSYVVWETGVGVGWWDVLEELCMRELLLWDLRSVRGQGIMHQGSHGFGGYSGA